MDFEHSAKAAALRDRLEAFLDENIYPNEPRFFTESMELGPWRVWPVVEELKAKAQGRRAVELVPAPARPRRRAQQVDYAPLCEVMGRSHLAPEVFNCSAPDTGNMEVLVRYGTAEHKKRWLEPLLAGDPFLPSP